MTEQILSASAVIPENQRLAKARSMTPDRLPASLDRLAAVVAPA